MYKLLITIACVLAYPMPSPAQQHIAVLGSSTAEGIGAVPISNSWVNLLQKYYQGLGQIDTIYNLALSGISTYTAMPTGFIPPDDSPRGTYPVPQYNVTTALSYHPAVVIASFPSNDIGYGFPLKDYLSNLRVIYDTVVAQGVRCYITTTQPRTSFTDAQKLLLKEARDSILMEFPGFSLDFYDPIVAADSVDINPIYDLDGTHVNNAGHMVLFQVVVNANILGGISLPLTLTNFTAEPEQGAVLVRWTDVNEDGPALFEVQRSADGVSFESQMQENVRGTEQAAGYSWTDQQPLTGRSYYRLQITQAGAVRFSQVVSIVYTGQGMYISKLYIDGNSMLTVQLSIPNDQLATLQVITTAGVLIRQQSCAVSSPVTTIPVNLSNLAAGEYFIKITAANGQSAVKPFFKR